MDIESLLHDGLAPRYWIGLYSMVLVPEIALFIIVFWREINGVFAIAVILVCFWHHRESLLERFMHVFRLYLNGRIDGFNQSDIVFCHHLAFILYRCFTIEYMTANTLATERTVPFLHCQASGRSILSMLTVEP